MSRDIFATIKVVCCQSDLWLDSCRPPLSSSSTLLVFGCFVKHENGRFFGNISNSLPHSISLVGNQPTLLRKISLQMWKMDGKLPSLLVIQNSAVEEKKAYSSHISHWIVNFDFPQTTSSSFLHPPHKRKQNFHLIDIFHSQLVKLNFIFRIFDFFLAGNSIA